MHSFSRAMLTIMGIGATVWGLSALIPHISANFFIDALLRSLGIVVLYGVLILWLAPAPDINEFASTYWEKIKKNILH